MLVKGSKRKEESYRESLSLLREYLSNVNVNENMDGKGHSDEVCVKMINMLLDTGGKTILVMK